MTTESITPSRLPEEVAAAVKMMDQLQTRLATLKAKLTPVTIPHEAEAQPPANTTPIYPDRPPMSPVHADVLILEDRIHWCIGELISITGLLDL